MELTSYIVPEQPQQLERFYGRTFSEVLQPQDKLKLWGPSLDLMQKLFDQFQCRLPSTMLQRLVTLDGSDFEKFFKDLTDESEEPVGPAFTDPRSRYCFLNTDYYAMRARYLGITEELSIIYGGVHELAHSPQYTDIWLPQPNFPINKLPLGETKIKQYGFVDENTSENEFQLNMLLEGFIDTIARQILHEQKRYDFIYAYPELMQLIYLLNIKLGPTLSLYRAVYQKNGLSTLKLQVDSVLGPNTLDRIAQTMAEDEDDVEDALVFKNTEIPPYQKTVALLTN